MEKILHLVASICLHYSHCEFSNASGETFISEFDVLIQVIYTNINIVVSQLSSPLVPVFGKINSQREITTLARFHPYQKKSRIQCSIDTKYYVLI
jgi:hypothetical protein